MKSRLIPLLLGIALVVGACGSDEAAIDDYTAQVAALIDRAELEAAALYTSGEGAVLAADAASLGDFTPQDLHVALEAMGAIERWVLEEAAALDPPEDIAALHTLMFDNRFTVAREALAARAATASDWEELSATPEMAAYRAAVTRDKQVCYQIEAELTAPSDDSMFADTPWMSGGLREVVEHVFDCSYYPANPNDMFRPPSS